MMNKVCVLKTEFIFLLSNCLVYCSSLCFSQFRFRQHLKIFKPRLLYWKVLMLTLNFNCFRHTLRNFNNNVKKINGTWRTPRKYIWTLSLKLLFVLQTIISTRAQIENCEIYINYPGKVINTYHDFSMYLLYEKYIELLKVWWEIWWIHFWWLWRHSTCKSPSKHCKISSSKIVAAVETFTVFRKC